ncbi:MAG: hypothetical protein HOP19_11875 [Acidobacteria bacterium]|nr:hypothetical protein [Acidobacteriota bacterium]
MPELLPELLEEQVNTRQRTAITVETHKVTIIRHRNMVRAWCDGCEAECDWLDAEQAAVWSGQTTRAVCRQVEAGVLHFRETGDGRLLICLASLLAEPRGEPQANVPRLNSND